MSYVLLLILPCIYLLRIPFKKYKIGGKACGLIFQDGGSHKPKYIYISFYQNNKLPRSYYRKESAASSPKDQRQHAQFAEYVAVYMISLCEDEM
jgi:hypothetical protein